MTTESPRRALAFLHHRDEANPGDMLATPARYFDWPRIAEVVERGVLDPVAPVTRADVILGGGGLVGNDHFSPSIARHLNAFEGRKILWGAGQNRHGYPFGFRAVAHGPERWRAEIRGWLVRRGWRAPSQWSRSLVYRSEQETASELAGFDLVGLRDWGTPHAWVPCPSCLHPALDRHRDDRPRHAVVFADHPKFFAIEVSRAPKLSNLDSSIDAMIRFIASGRSVVTSSYHVAYWGILLGRRVVVAPWSSKFLRFKWPVELAIDLDGLAHHLARARVFPDALAEARAANVAFAGQVAALLQLPPPVPRFSPARVASVVENRMEKSSR